MPPEKDKPETGSGKDRQTDAGKGSTATAEGKQPVTPAKERVEKAAEVVQADKAAQETGASTQERRELAAKLLADTKPPKEAEAPKPPEGKKTLTVAERRAADQAIVDAAEARMKEHPDQGFQRHEVDAMHRLKAGQDKPKRVTREKGYREGTFEHFEENLSGALTFVQIRVEGYRDPLLHYVGRFDDANFYAEVEQAIKKSRVKGMPKPEEATIVTLRSRSSRISHPKAAEKAAEGDTKAAEKDSKAAA